METTALKVRKTNFNSADRLNPPKYRGIIALADKYCEPGRIIEFLKIKKRESGER